MRKNKKVLSLLLALVMVFATAVPAFATGVLYEKVEVHTMVEGKLSPQGSRVIVKEGNTLDDISSELKHLDASSANFGRYHLGRNLKASTDYEFSVPEAEVVKGTPWKYEFTTDAQGKIDMSSVEITNTSVDGIDAPEIKDNILHFDFTDTNTVKLKGGDFTVQLVNEEKKPISYKRISVYPVKQDGTKYLLDKETKSYIVDWDNKISTSDSQYYITDTNGQIILTSPETEGATENTTLLPKYSYPSFDVLKTNAGPIITSSNPTGYGNDVDQQVVAFVYDPDNRADSGDEIYVFSDLQEDDYALLSKDKYETTLEVTVKGVKNGKEEVVEGAVVKVYPNTTQLWGEETYDEKPIAEGKTGAHGVVTFKNLDLENIMRYLSGAGFGGRPIFTEIKLPFKVVVEEAEGWTVPRTVEIPFRDINFRGTTAAKVTLLPGSAFGNRIAGEDRLETSVEVARKAYPNGSTRRIEKPVEPVEPVESVEPVELNGEKTKVVEEGRKVVIASGYNFADSLVANGIVGLEDAPLLLSNTNALTKSAMDYMAEVGAKEAILVGGPNTLTSKVIDQLEAAGITSTRVYGNDRFATSAKVLDYVVRNQNRVADNTDKGNKKDYDGTVMLANGRVFADALVASVPSAIYTQPILLTETNAVPSSVKAALADTKYQINKVMVVGGPNSVSSEALAQINISNIDRLSGDNRQLTSMAIADEYFTHGGQAIVVNGKDYPDALSAGQLGFKENAPILLTDSPTVLGEDLAKYLNDNRMTEIHIVGGPNSVSETVAGELANLLVSR